MDAPLQSPEEEPDETEDRGVPEHELASCPRCKHVNVVDARRSLRRQRCTGCGMKLMRGQKKRRWLVAGGGGLKARPQRERVWMPVAGVTVGVVLVAIFLLWMRLRPDPVPAPVPVVPERMREEIAEVVARLGRAVKAEEFLALIREPEKYAGEVRAWCSAEAEKLPLRGEMLDVGAEQKALGHSLVRATASFADRPLVQLLLVKTGEGWRLDWRAFTQRGDLTVGEFLERRAGEESLVFAVVQRSSYYNGPYADKEGWLSLRVTDAAGQHGFFAAVSRGNVAAVQALADLPMPAVREGEDLARYARRKALRLKWTHPDTVPPQAEVTAVAGEGWFVP